MVTHGKYARTLWVALVALLVLASASPLGSAHAQSPTSTPGAPGGELELVGVIAALGTDSIVVNDVTVYTVGAEIKTQLQVGLAVKVHGQLQADRSIRAREVEAIGADDQGVRPGEAEFVGVMSSFIGQIMVVNGMTVDVSAAEIYGRLDPGGLVWVHAVWDAANSVWIAREVGPFAPTRDIQGSLPRFSDDEWEIVGTLAALTADSVTISGLVIDTRSAEIDDSVTLAIGALVKAEVRLVDGQLVATKLERGDTQRLRESLRTRGRSGIGGFDDNSNSNDNDGNDNDDDRGNDNGDDNGNDNGDDHGNDNRGDDHGNDNSRGNDNGDDRGGDD